MSSIQSKKAGNGTPFLLAFLFGPAASTAACCCIPAERIEGQAIYIKDLCMADDLMSTALGNSAIAYQMQANRREELCRAEAMRPEILVVNGSICRSRHVKEIRGK